MSWVILSDQIEEEVTFLIHQQTILQNLTEASLDRVLTLPKNLGKIIDGAFGLGSDELRGLQTLDEIVNSEAAITAIVGNSYAFNILSGSSMFVSKIANSIVAMDKVADSVSALNAIINSNTSISIIESSDIAKAAISSSALITTAAITSSVNTEQILYDGPAVYVGVMSSYAFGASYPLSTGQFYITPSNVNVIATAANVRYQINRFAKKVTIQRSYTINATITAYIIKL